MTGCRNCGHTPGLRECAARWTTRDGVEVVRQWIACCDCEAGAALMRGGDGDGKTPATPRLTYRQLEERLRDEARAKRHTLTGWWVTPIRLDDGALSWQLPAEARWTTAERERMAVWRQAGPASGAAGSGIGDRGGSHVQSRPEAPRGSWGGSVAREEREGWDGQADGDDPGPWESVGGEAW